ncbi:type VI secretion system ATPase TssH [Deferribacter abyssi]|uniref:type VI secretion system ATPase TssH n=1 Tax=Deferribacter abyssi TaxID=213806 RepID=UPI003C1FE7B2
MVNVDLKGLILRLNDFCTNILQASAGYCMNRGHYEICIEHFIAKIIEDSQSDWSYIFQSFGIDSSRFKKFSEEVLEGFKTGNTGKPVFSPMLIELFQDSWLISSIDLGEKKIRSGAIMIALLSRPNFYLTGRYGDILKKINRDTLLNNFLKFTKSSKETTTVSDRDVSDSVSDKVASGEFLSRFCINFTEKAKRGEIDPVFGRDKEIRQIIDILSRRRKNNPICVGEPGVGKTAVVEGLALRIVEGDVPDFLKDVTLLGLDIGLLEAGASMKGEFENRLKGVIEEVKTSEKPIIMFIDEAHTLIGAGGNVGGSDAANLLKPALARGELRTIAATTWSEYKKYFEKDPALARRFQLVKLDEPDVENTKLILRGLKEHYERWHGVIIRDGAINTAAELSNKYITGRFLPDKAIDLLDTSCARVKISQTAKPSDLEDTERKIQALERKKRALERDKESGNKIDKEEYRHIISEIKKLKKEETKLKNHWEKEKKLVQTVLSLRKELDEQDKGEKGKIKTKLNRALKELNKIQNSKPMIHIEVTPEVVAEVVSHWTGIPLGRMLRDEAETIINLQDRLKEYIKGQDHALNIISEVIKSAKAGISSPDSPIGVFLLVGPSGVGKTETGLALAEILFGSRQQVITINMSEFQESHTVSRLIGSPPGYVGYGEGGMLTEAVRHKPYSVVLLDEVEKAHIDVMNLFYQVFDKGILTDGEGKEISFKNTILLLTSNLASDIIQKITLSENNPPEPDTVINHIRPILSKHFKPALLARMTIVPYYSLKKDALKRIVELKLNKLKQTLEENNKIKLKFEEDVVELITERCKEVETGARNIEYILNINVLPKLSKSILTYMTTADMPSEVHLKVNKAKEFFIEFK